MPFSDLAPQLAASGLFVFPASSETKAPLLKGWEKKATRDAVQIETWAREYPDCRPAVACGPSGLIVIDLDMKHGKNGIETWRTLCAQHGPAPDTFTVVTPSGGLHLYFRGQGKTTVEVLGKGVDVRSRGGLVVYYPVPLHNPPLPIADAPAWLLSLASGRSLDPTAPDEAVAARITPASERRAVTSEEWAERADTWPEPQRSDARAVLVGEAWGEPGQREIRLSKLALFLVRDFPWLDPDATADLFADSCRAVELEDNATTTTEWVAQKLRDKIRPVAARAAAEAEEHAEAAAIVARLRAARTRPANPPQTATGAPASPTPRRTALTASREDLDRIARASKPDVARALRLAQDGAQLTPADASAVSLAVARAVVAKGAGLDVSGSAAALGVPETELSAAVVRAQAERRKAEDDHGWVLGTPQGYFLRAAGGYEGPFAPELVPARARDSLDDTGLVLGEWTQSKYAPKSATQLLHEYGTVPTTTEFTLCGETRLEANTFVYKALREPVIVPERNEQIETWLRMLAGHLEGALLDWLATFRRFDKPTSAVMLRAFPGVGKGLFIDGLARLFSAGKAVPFPEAIGSFNGLLTTCPIVVADEGLVAPPNVNAVDELKKLVSDSSIRVADKNVRATTLRGCVRVILTSNHHGNFRFMRELTEADVAALDQRVLLLEPGRETADYLARIGGRAHTEAWVEGLGFARHVAWLESTREVVSGARFLVEGRGGLSGFLSAESRGTSPVLRTVLQALRTRNDAVRVIDGKVLVHKRGVSEQWASLNTWDNPPDDLESAWGLVCAPGTSHLVKVGSRPVRMCEVRLQLVRRAAERLCMGEVLTEVGIEGESVTE